MTALIVLIFVSANFAPLKYIGYSRYFLQIRLIPILAAFTTNTLTKMVFAFSAGGARFALCVVPGLVLMVIAAWAGALFVPSNTAP